MTSVKNQSTACAYDSAFSPSSVFSVWRQRRIDRPFAPPDAAESGAEESPLRGRVVSTSALLVEAPSGVGASWGKPQLASPCVLSQKLCSRPASWSLRYTNV